MVEWKLPTDADANVADVYVIIQAAKAYSEAELELVIHVDPWYLVDKGMLGFKKNWLLLASLHSEETAHGIDISTSSRNNSGGASYDETTQNRPSHENTVSSVEQDRTSWDNQDPLGVSQSNQLILYQGPSFAQETARSKPSESSETRSQVRFKYNHLLCSLH